MAMNSSTSLSSQDSTSQLAALTDQTNQMQLAGAHHDFDIQKDSSLVNLMKAAGSALKSAEQVN